MEAGGGLEGEAVFIAWGPKGCPPSHPPPPSHHPPPQEASATEKNPRERDAGRSPGERQGLGKVG